MKIHLTRTIDFPMYAVDEIALFLNQFAKAILFVAKDFYVPSKIEKPYYSVSEIIFEKPNDNIYHSNFEHKGLIYMCKYAGVKRGIVNFQPSIENLKQIHANNTLAWNEIFEYCNYYRKFENIDEHDFVVLLSEKPNEHHWFSMFDNNKNIYVHTENNWGDFKLENMKYLIAYQIMENIMQSLMEVDIINIPNEHIHAELRGCMNDFCANKKEVIIKLQTANICDTCIDTIKTRKIDENILQQTLHTFEAVRNKIIYKPAAAIIAAPQPIVITQRNEIILPNLNNTEIALTPLYKTLYFFFLQHPEGVKLKDLSNYNQQLMHLYNQLSVNENQEKMQASINELTNPLGESFLQKRAKINKIIEKTLGPQLAPHYIIDGKRGEAYKIQLPKNLIEINK